MHPCASLERNPAKELATASLLCSGRAMSSEHNLSHRLIYTAKSRLGFPIG
jgi:hypothetical protein